MIIEMDTYGCIIVIIIYFNHIPSTITVRNTVFVKRGSTLNLSCPFQAVTTPITWRGPPNLATYSINKNVNNQIDKSKRICVSGNSTKHQYNLSLSNFTTIDTGLFRCHTLINKRSMSYEIVVHIADPPTNMKIDNETTGGFVIGEQHSLLDLICTVNSGKPQSTLKYKFENSSVISNSSEYILKSFVARRHHHLKHFECIAENEFYRLAKVVQLYIYSSPLVHVYVESLATVEEGNNITLFCWYESNVNETVLHWKRHSIPVINTQNENLTLTNVSMEDTGSYCCEVENRVGKSTDMINITVLYKPRVMSYSNVFEIESEFEKPSFISFTIASGTKPYIAWTNFLGGKTGPWNVQDIGKDIYNVSSTIVPYEKIHLGHYTVRVRNTIGSVSLNIELVGLSVNISPSKLVCNVSNVIELNCNVSQFSTSNLSNIWVHSYYGTEIRTLLGSVKNRSSKLQIPFCDYRDAGTYTCIWKSSTTSHSCSSKVDVRSHPVLTSIRLFEEYGKTTLMVYFYAFPPPMEVLWFFKDKTISTALLSVGNNMQETEVKLLIKSKSVFVKGYSTSYQINRTKSLAVKLYSCQVRNIMGNLEASFYELNNTRNNPKNNGRIDGKIHWVIYVLIGGFFIVVVMIVTISLLSDRYLLRKSRKHDGQNAIQSERDIGSRNGSHHSYEEIDSVYYHTVELRNYNVDASLPVNNALIVNTNSSI